MSRSDSDKENDADMEADASDESDDSEEEDEDGGSPRRRGKPKVIREISYEDAMEQLRRLSEALPPEEDEDDQSQGSRSRARRKPVKKPANLKAGTCEEIYAAVVKEANNSGLANEELDIIWNVISHPLTTITDKFSAKLILCMIPAGARIDRNRISDIIHEISSFGDQSKLAALKYLLGIFDYNLCDKEPFAEYPAYFRIFFSGRTNRILPWMCAFMKRISSANLVSLDIINDMMDLVRKPLLNTTALRAIVDLLRYFKLLRPDLLPYNVFRMSAIGANKKLTLDEHFLESLYRTKCRFLGIQGGADGHLMETGEPDCDLVGIFLTKLNAQCFPEFQIHVNGDPEPDNYDALVKMPKYDRMRCALKTRESLPFIVNDPETFECFNTFVSLILQHKFDDYDPKDEDRYRFILSRIYEVTIMGRKAVPAMTEWLLDYLLLWDGLLFKFQIHELLSWLPPVDFADGYIHVLYKLETLFLYGEDVDRFLVWSTLTQMASDWIVELGAAMEDPGVEENAESLKKAVGFLLDFMNSLVGKVLTVDGHKDEAFLVRCCNTYIKLNKRMNDIKDPPFYVFPPTYLWVMVVLSDSLVAIDAFCDLYTKALPRRSLTHLKKTVHQEVYRKWNQEVIPDMFRYFGRLGVGEGPIFQSLFVTELDGLNSVIAEDGAGGAQLSQIGEQCQLKVEELMAGLSELTALNSKAFEEVLLESDSDEQPDNFLSNLDKDLMLEVAPNVLQLLKNFKDSEDSGTSSNVTERI